ncbi:BCCT family transporter [Parendozoicomonas haliclonae]|uniref:High-affinity choline transport protein n=1 Tax=Parendozoicomonas haliclonae TaxID=1960125 RepID=A0A1X7APS2_9GAMM|nr:choline BCCT transporter BetT [Parendozoicomonas haliclonae]SMA50098.1 High-affinity choline transport protein [Parendozoicomonas haliclonae]
MASSKKPNHTLNPPVFIGSAALILLLVGYTALFPTHSGQQFDVIQTAIMTNGSWFYVAAVALILIGVVCVGFSRYGDIKLGPDHSEPDFSFSSWFAMLFSAGMGIGLMFFGVGEPVMHFLSPPQGEPGTIQAAKEAMGITFFHWGFHAWAIYAIVALILAFFGYRHNLPLTLRSALYPLIGDKIYGPIGHFTDIFAIIGTTFGVATALGYGVLQVNSGLNYLFDIAVSTQTQVILIIAITALATLSVASGLDKGIRILSEINLLLALLLLLLVICLGPTILLLQMFVQNIGGYLSELVNKTFNLYAYQPNDWLGGWTLFYWAWWLSWSPFVGMFIARISRGRTIREFISGVLFVPSALTFLWMTVFGNTSINMIMHEGAEELGTIVQTDVSLALFKFLEYFPFTGVLSGISVIMIVVFFVTSSDSSAMVIDLLASKDVGRTPVWQRIFWSCIIGLVALVLMLAGGLKALQTATIATALPFSMILLVSGWGLLKALAVDATKKESLNQTTLAPSTSNTHIPWQTRLQNVTHFPERKSVNLFISKTVVPAMQSVVEEIKKHGVEATIEYQDARDRPAVVVRHGDEHDFLYKVKPRAYMQPSFIVDNEDEDDIKYYRAEVFLLEGGQDYDIMGWTQDQVIADIISQYEKHMYFLHMVRD